MLGVVQESVRLLQANTKSHLGTPARMLVNCIWWSVHPILIKEYRVSLVMVLKQTGVFVCVWEMYNDWEGSRTKSESQLRGAHLQLASKKGETH